MRPLVVVLSVLFAVIIILGNVVFLFNNQAFHSQELKKLGINETQAVQAAALISYLSGKEGQLPVGFTEREQAHLHDVRSLFSVLRGMYYTSLIALAGVTIYLLRKGTFSSVMAASLCLGGAFSLIVVLGVVVAFLVVDFSILFDVFHRPFFAAGSWRFPSDSLMISIFPEQFFQAAARTLLRLIFVNAAVFFGIGLYLRRRERMHKPY